MVRRPSALYAVLGHDGDGNSGPFRELHKCAVPLGDATRRPTPDTEIAGSQCGGGETAKASRAAAMSGQQTFELRREVVGL